MIEVHIYVSQLPAILANFERYPECVARAHADGVRGFAAMIKQPDAELASFPALVERAAKLGFSVIPGIRLAESVPPGGWFDAEWWARKADWHRRIVSVIGKGQRIAADGELHNGNLPRPAVEDLRAAAAPYLDAIRDSESVPCYLPASVTDPLTTVIVEAASKAELWFESTYSIPIYRRVNPISAEGATLAYFRNQAAGSRLWPHAKSVPGLFGDVLRDWGRPYLGQIKRDLGDDLWIFLFPKSDVLKFGTPEWFTGETLSSTNRPVHTWNLWPGALKSNPGGASFKRYTALPVPGVARPDIRSELGLLVDGSSGYRADKVIPVGSDVSICWGGVLPSGNNGPVFGACVLNQETWQVSIDGDRLSLDLRQPTQPLKLSTTMGTAILRNTPLRIVIVLRDTTWAWFMAQEVRSAETGKNEWRFMGAGSIKPPSRVTVGSGQLVLSAGTVIGVREGSDWKRAVTDKIVHTDVEIHPRAFNDVEAVKVVTSPFPRSS